MTRPTTTSAGIRIGIAHDVPRELRPVPRQCAPQARADGYAAPGLVSVLLRAVRRLLDSKGSL